MSRPADAGKKMYCVCEQKHAPVAFTIRNFFSSNRSRRCNNRARFGVDTKMRSTTSFYLFMCGERSTQDSTVYLQSLHINLWQRLNDYLALRFCVRWMLLLPFFHSIRILPMARTHESRGRRAHELVRS